MIKAFRACVEIEETIAQIYQLLAERMPEQHPLRRIWEQMADEELEHAQILKFAQKLDIETYDGFNFDSAQLAQLQIQVKETYDLIQIRSWEDNEAVTMMLGLEEQFQVVHVKFAAKFKDSSIQQMFARLGSDDEMHVKRLKHYVAQTGSA